MRNNFALLALAGCCIAVVVGIANGRDAVECSIYFALAFAPFGAAAAFAAVWSSGRAWVRAVLVIDCLVSAAIAMLLCDGDPLAWGVFFCGLLIIVPMVLALVLSLGLGWLILAILRPPFGASECGCSRDCHCGKPYC